MWFFFELDCGQIFLKGFFSVSILCTMNVNVKKCWACYVNNQTYHLSFKKLLFSKVLCLEYIQHQIMLSIEMKGYWYHFILVSVRTMLCWIDGYRKKEPALTKVYYSSHSAWHHISTLKTVLRWWWHQTKFIVHVEYPNRADHAFQCLLHVMRQIVYMW